MAKKSSGSVIKTVVETAGTNWSKTNSSGKIAYKTSGGKRDGEGVAARKDMVNNKSDSY